MFIKILCGLGLWLIAGALVGLFAAAFIKAGRGDSNE
jgi:hypothetical protein